MFYFLRSAEPVSPGDIAIVKQDSFVLAVVTQTLEEDAAC